MDNKALAETYVDLWIYIDVKVRNKREEEYDNTITNMIFEQTCKRIISDLIGKQRQGVPSQQSSSSDEKPSEKQIKYAEDLGCAFAENLTRAGISKWIKEHK